MRRHRVTNSLAGLLMTLCSSQSSAQERAASRATPPDDRATIEEILVTASGRATNLQAVPIAASAFQGSDLRMRLADEFEDLALVSPSLHANTTNSATNGGSLRIRGVGTTGNNLGLEAAVGTFIDGVYRSRSGHGFSDLLDIERIEVLRGPQGTLLGKNTSAGAIHVVTKQPNLSEVEGSVVGEYGNYDHRRLAASVTGPIVSGALGYRLAASWTRRDGYFDDANRSASYADRDRWSLRGNLLWKTDRFAARLIADFREQDESCCPASWVVGGPTLPLVASLASALGLGRDIPTTSGVDVSGKRRVGGVTPGQEPFEGVQEGGLSLELSLDLDRVDLTSISAWRSIDVDLAQDSDFGSAAIIGTVPSDTQFVSVSQELRSTGVAWEKLDWLLGVYGYNEKLDHQEGSAFGEQGGLFRDALLIATNPALAPLSDPGQYPVGGGSREKWATRTSGWAVFTHNILRPIEKLELSVGARYSSEGKRAQVSVNEGTPGPIVSDPALTLPGQIRNDPTPAALPGATLPWCEELTASGLNQIRSATGLCDNVSWRSRRREREWTYLASIAYRTEAATAYASYAHGYKAGGFAPARDAVRVVNFGTPAAAIVDASRFGPEFADTYELGLKLTLWGGRARVNLAGFFSEFDDYQLNTFNGQRFVVSNVAEVTSKGVELEAFVSPLDQLHLTLGVTYADARYGYANLCFPLQDPFGRVNRCTAPGGTPGANDSPPGFFPEDPLIDGKRVTNAPRWAGSGSILYERPLVREWTLFGALNASFRSERNTNPILTPLGAEPSHWLVNLQGGVRSPDARWEIALWVTNLTDELDRSLVLFPPLPAGSVKAFVNPPRMWGGSIRYAFGAGAGS